MKIDVRNISFGFYSNKMVLNNINLCSKENKTLAIVGTSGCGKSTFLRLLCGVLPNTKTNSMTGNILINGLTPTAFTQQGKVGFIFQDPSLFPNLTVRENISLPLKFRGSVDNNLIDQLIETVGLKEFQKYLPKDLSGGMKTRVALARTFVTRPLLLLLDEPFSALDIHWKFMLYQELEILRESYSPMVIIVTHDIQEALLLSNHILVFGKEGNILDEIILKQKIPRVFNPDEPFGLQNELQLIQNLIIKNGLKNEP